MMILKNRVKKKKNSQRNERVSIIVTKYIKKLKTKAKTRTKNKKGVDQKKKKKTKRSRELGWFRLPTPTQAGQRCDL